MTPRRLILAMVASALVLGGALTVPVPAAMALPCIAWGGTLTYDQETGVITQDTVCVAYASDPPADQRPDRPNDPGSGRGGGGSTATPGSPESCSEVGDEIAALKAQIETLKTQWGSIQYDIALREKDRGDTRRALEAAEHWTAAARQVQQTTWDEYLANDGEVDLQFDGRGKPIHPSPAVRAAATRVATAKAAEDVARANDRYAAGRVTDSRNQLAAVERDGAAAEAALDAALARQATEKCPG